jgi:hypothetical protein
MKKIRPKERDAVIQSLKAGVVPKMGLHHIQVGRVNEVSSLIKDINRIADSGSAFRLIIGEYGSGKTFFLQLVRLIALEKGLVTVHADLSPEKRLYSTGGQARNLYSELMRNISTRTKPDGNAITSIVERFIGSAIEEAKDQENDVETIISERLSSLSELVSGYDFANVISSYWKGYESGNDQLKADAIRWLRAEFSTKTDARKALDVRTIIDDSSFYNHLKLLSLFVQQAGYKGLMVCLDEMVNLYKLANSKARHSNYEQILHLLNDSFQGVSSGLGFVLGGTPEFLMDPRRGLYSYQALQSRLAENTFAKQANVTDYNSTTLHMQNLSPEDLFVLLTKIRFVFASGNEDKYLIPDDAIKSFMNHCLSKIGDAYFRTPRNTIKSFIDLLSILEQNPSINWSDLIEKIELNEDKSTDLDINTEDSIQTKNNELASFKL